MILACLFVKGSSKDMVQQVHLFNTENYDEKPFSIFQLDDDGLSAEIRQLKFSPDGLLIMLGTTDNVIFLIDSYEGRTKHRLRAPIYNEVGSSGMLLEAGFSPDSKYLITGSEGRRKVICWNLETE